VLAGGNAAAGVLDRDRAVEVDDHFHAVAVPAEVLVDGVVDDLPLEVVESLSAVHVTDVHAGPLADGLEPFENEKVAGVIRGHEGFRISAHTD
jgi:hypothetical protein